MWPFARKPSVTDKLIDLLREQQRVQATATQQLVETAAQQAAVFQQWMTVFTNAPAPQVRVMDDYGEALHEAQRRATTRPHEPPVPPFTTVDPGDWLRDLTADFKQELAG